MPASPLRRGRPSLSGLTTVELLALPLPARWISMADRGVADPDRPCTGVEAAAAAATAAPSTPNEEVGSEGPSWPSSPPQGR